MNHHSYFGAAARRVEACLVGSGAFGRSLLATRVPQLSVRVAVDMDTATAAAALRSAGWSADSIVEVEGPDMAARAFTQGKAVAASNIDHVLGLPVEIVVEATGHPEAGARHADRAIAAGKHVALVSKEADSVVGPYLAAVAARKGLVVTPVDGDQPSLLIGLVTWAEVLGMDIVAAGKSSEYDFVYDPQTQTLASNGATIAAPGFDALMELGSEGAADMVAARAKAAAGLPQRAVPDLCEMGVVAHSVDLTPDTPEFHVPLARTAEVPSLFTTSDDGGLLAGGRRIDVFNCLRLPGELSFAGGVFVVVRVQDAESWDILAAKGHVMGRNGNTAMIALPRHLLGIEAATSILEAALLNRSSGAASPRPRLDLVATATRDLPAGTQLSAFGHHHTIDGVSAALVPASALGPEAAAPYYLVANRRLTQPVAAGHAIRIADVDIDGSSDLGRLRRAQDALFFPERQDASAGAAGRL